ncbi:MAG: hypothetical protein AAGA62_19655, partial [Bacteroidota bacterium]
NIERIFSNEDGRYVLAVREGETYTLSLPPSQCYELISNPEAYTLTYSPDSTYQFDFGLTPRAGEASLRVLLNSGTIRCGFEADFWLTVINDGCVPLAGDASISFPETMTFLEAAPNPLTSTINALTFTFDTLAPGVNQRIRIRFRLPDENFTGQPVVLGTVASAEAVGGVMLNANFTYNETLRCAIDPNDKQVSPARAEPSNSNYTQIDEKIRYTIRFQNTGNDTAFTVRIQDRIDDHLDLLTFTPLTASHPYSVSVRKDRTVVFLFEDILLPDSTTNLPLSQGFVTFEIEPLSGLDDFTVIDNTAGIYFDFNQPVITNTVNNTLVEFLDEDADGFFFY